MQNPTPTSSYPPSIQEVPPPIKLALNSLHNQMAIEFSNHLDIEEQTIDKDDLLNLQSALNFIIANDHPKATEYLSFVDTDSKYKDLLTKFIKYPNFKSAYTNSLRPNITLKQLCLDILLYNKYQSSS